MTDPQVTPELFLYEDSESVYLAESAEHATKLRAEAFGVEIEALLSDPFELMDDTRPYTVTAEDSWSDPREEHICKYEWRLTTTILEWRTNSSIGPVEAGEWLGPQ